jgi:hypothetical protein
MSEALGSQWFGDSYNFAKGLAAGKGWAGFNPEQQAEPLEKAFAEGYIGSTDPEARFLVRLTNPDTNHGFEVEVVSASIVVCDVGGPCDARAGCPVAGGGPAAGRAPEAGRAESMG